jgi:glucose/arabinose dehydrogenase
LQVTTFASGLDFPTSLTELSDGSLLVGTTTPASGNSFTTYYTGSGQVTRFTDTNQPGVADNTGTVVVSGLAGAVTSVRQLGNGLIAVATTGTGSTNVNLFAGDIYLYKQGAHPNDPYTQVSDVHVQFASSDAAINIALDAQPTQNTPGSYDLFFGLAAGNNDGTPSPNVTVSGSVSASLPTGSIYKMTVDTNPATPVLSAPVQVANGLRNTGGLVSDASGNVYFGDNGYDLNGLPESTDELNRLTSAEIGSGTVTFYGYPGNYTQYGTNTFVGGQGDPGLVSFQPSNNLSGTDSYGVTELALAPTGFPTGLNNGIFVTFHGVFASSGPANNANPLVYYDFGTQTYYNFIADGLTGVGHLDGVYSTQDSLFVADFSDADGFTGGTGVIYEISAQPEPASWSLMLVALAPFLLYRRLMMKRQ